MPGNEVGDRIHNFFGQENLSQGQHHPEVVEGTWPGLGNNQWVGSQRQIGTPFISNFKNHSLHQSADSERGTGGQSSGLQHGVNFSQSILRPEFVRSQSQNQQPALNGYMHGNQVFQTRQNETNFLGVDSEPDRRNLTSRGFSVLEAQIGSGAELNKKNSLRMDFNESPVNYDFLGGQQQMNQHPGSFQSLQRQHSGIDMQLLQQQVMLKQMQEFQRQQHQQQQQQHQQQRQQLQQQEGRQLNSVNQVSAFAKQASGSHPSALVNGITIHDASNYSWQPELLAGDTNWPHRGMSPAMQGSSTGLMFSSEQGQGPRLMGMIPQPIDQSLYGVPISGARAASNQFSSVQMDKSALQQISGSNNSFLGNQYSGFPDHASVQDGTLVTRQGYEGKNMIGTADSQGLNGGFNLENLQQMDTRQSNGPGQDFHGRQDLVGSSETSQDKSVMQVTPSQNAATLDPTEEKILFGSDDNLWESVGRGANMGSGSYNMLDGTDLFGALPSVQSGSWSALMQSAVAETSSADMGLQEQWSGMTFQSSEPPAGNQSTPTATDSSKQQSTWADNRLQAARSYNVSGGTNTSINHNNVLGGKQSGVSSSHEQSELHAGSSQRFVQPFSREGTNWLDRKHLQNPVTEGSHNNEKSAHSSDAELNSKRISGPWTSQQSISSYDTGGQSSRTNGWKFVDSASPGMGTVMKNQGNENLLQASQKTEHKSPMFEAMGHGAGVWKSDTVSNSIIESEHAKSTTGSPQVNRGDSDYSNVAALPDSSTLRANQESSQHLPNGNNIDIWKHVDSSVNSKGREFPGKFQSHMDKGCQTFESSGNNSLGNGAVESHDAMESKIDSSRNALHHTSTSGGRENAWLDANDLSGGKQKSSSNIGRKPSGIRKFQYHPMGDLDVDVDPTYGAKNATPMQSMPTQVSQGLRGHDLGGVGHSKFPAQIARDSMEIDKGQFPGFQGETKSSEEMTLKNRLSGSVPSTSTSFDRGVHNYAASKTTPSSQNMLELLHKVDQSREHGNAAHFSTSDGNQSFEMHEAKQSAASVQHQQHQSSASQGFGLQLAPPSQLLPIKDNALSSQSPSQTFNSLSSAHVTSEVGEKGHTWLASTPSVQAMPPSCETSQGELRNVSGTAAQTSKNHQGNFSAGFSPGFPYSRSLLQNQQMFDKGGHVANSQSGNLYFDRFVSQPKMNESFERAKIGQSAMASMPDMSRSSLQNSASSSGEMPQLSNNNQNSAKDSPQQFPILESVSAPQGSSVSGASRENAFAKVSHAMRTGVTAQQRSFGSHPFKVSSNMFKSNLQPNNDSETTSFRSQKLEGHNVQRIGNSTSESGAGSADSRNFVGKELPAKGDQSQQNTPENDPAQKMTGGSQGKESIANSAASTSISDPNSTQREIEAFGRSLKPNNILNQNYALMHQAQSIKNADMDPGNRSFKRFKGSDDVAEAQQGGLHGGQQFYGHNNMARDASINQASVSPGDSNMLSFSAKSTDARDTSIPSQDMLTFGGNDPQNFASSSTVSARTEHSQISPQMAPSWFGLYGNFKNGQIILPHDAQKYSPMNAMELPFTVGRPPNSLHAHGSVEQGNAIAADANQHGQLHKGSVSSVTSENFLSPQLMNLDDANVHLAALRPKKRKSATAELIPWHKQVIHGLQMLQNISSAALDWSRAANRLPEKVEDEPEILEDGPPVFRSKRRLILTTQLMQLLFRPPLGSILSADVMPHYESVVHFLARATLGDSCSSLSCAGSDNSMPSSSGNQVAAKTSETLSDQYFSKVVDDLINRAKQLENDMLRLDKRASVLDLRVECQELEKYSVINRFAKFHGRGQADGMESSLSSDSAANAQKSCLQRYVTALPMPRNLPDRGLLLFREEERKKCAIVGRLIGSGPLKFMAQGS